MLNTYNDNSTHSVVMNPPCIGTLQKTHAKSKFERFHLRSEAAEWVFSDVPHLKEFVVDGHLGNYDKYYESAGKYVKFGPEIVVLQLMCFGDNELLMEYVDKKDWEE